MESRTETSRSFGDIAAALRCPRLLVLALWPAATVLYGAVAGLLLHERPYIAAAVMTLVWLSAAWRPRAL